MSLLTMIQDASLLVGLTEPDSVMSATSDEVKQLRAIAQVEGDDLSRAHDWRKLKTSASIAGDGSTEFWDLPCDWDRQQAGDNLWLEDSPHLPLIGPISDQEMLALKAADASPSRPVWRYFGDQIQIWPVLASTDTVRMEYRSSYWIASEDGTTIRSRWLLDGDTPLMPERVVMLGIVWRWKQYKGLDYAEPFNHYQKEKMKAIRNDVGWRTLRLATDSTADVSNMRKNLYRVTA